MKINLCPACAPRVIEAAVRDHIDLLNSEQFCWYVMSYGAKAIDEEKRAVGGPIKSAAVPMDGGMYCEFHLMVAGRRSQQIVNGGQFTPYAPPGMGG